MNTGLIFTEPSIKDWSFGSSIPYEIKNPSGDWSAFLPAGEFQRKGDIETSACVSFSATNCLEIQLKFLTGKETNYSDRFLAKLSGTTQQGNTLQKVAQAIRKLGLVPEDNWPSDFSSWPEFYKEIPVDVIAKGQEFLRDWEVSYQWVPVEDIPKALKQGPLQVTVATCEGWKTGKPAACSTSPHHAVTLVSENLIFDHYSPYIKVIPKGYKIWSALQYIIRPRVQESYIYKLKSEIGINLPAKDDSQLVSLLQQFKKNYKLKKDGTLNFDSITIEKKL